MDEDDKLPEMTPLQDDNASEFLPHSWPETNFTLDITSVNLSEPTGSGGAGSVPWITKHLTTVLVPSIFGIIMVVGIIGNALVITVVATNAKMRNTTNVLILNLALADLLFIITCVPSTATDYVLNHWPFGLVWCQAVQYLIYSTSFVSIYTLILMSFDRFLAVVFPVSSLPYRTVTNAFCATSILWIVIGCSSVPIWFSHHLEESKSDKIKLGYNATDEDGQGANDTRFESSEVRPVRLWCRFADESYSQSGFQIAFFVSGYAIPLILICMMYLYMLNRLWHPTVGHQISQDSLRNKRRVTKLVLVVIIVFTVCWAPIQFVLLLKAIKMYSTSKPEDFSRVIFQVVSHVLAYLNSCVNPILYAFLSDNFRKAFHAILPDYCCCFFSSERRRRRRTSLHYELTTLKSGTRHNASGDTKRYGKRGKLVKHGARATTVTSPAALVENNTNAVMEIRRESTVGFTDPSMLKLQEDSNMNMVGHESSSDSEEAYACNGVDGGVVLLPKNGCSAASRPARSAGAGPTMTSVVVVPSRGYGDFSFSAPSVEDDESAKNQSDPEREEEENEEHGDPMMAREGLLCTQL